MGSNSLIVKPDHCVTQDEILPLTSGHCTRIECWDSGRLLINSCSSYWNSARNNRTVSGACAVMFDESCCKTGDTHLVVQNGQKGKLCGTVSSLNPFSSCKGPRLEDDIESFIVMPGCKLEVWDDRDGLSDAEDEEKKGFNQGDYKDQKDRYDQEKLVFSAQAKPHWVEILDDDFSDMDEDIGSYRCTCGANRG